MFCDVIKFELKMKINNFRAKWLDERTRDERDYDGDDDGNNHGDEAVVHVRDLVDPQDIRFDRSTDVTWNDNNVWKIWIQNRICDTLYRLQKPHLKLICSQAEENLLIVRR